MIARPARLAHGAVECGALAEDDSANNSPTALGASFAGSLINAVKILVTTGLIAGRCIGSVGKS
jgi:hypothetical protein